MAGASLARILKDRAASQPEGTAFGWLSGADRIQSWTYSELDALAQAVQAELRARGLNRESRVLLIAPPGMHFVAGFFGVLYAGSVVVPSYPSRPGESGARLRKIAEDAQVHAVLLARSQDTEHLAGALGPDVMRVYLDEIEVASGDRGLALEPCAASAPAFLQYTSGSTAEPKGVIVTHDAVLANLRDIQRAFGHSERSVGVNWLPPYHDMGLIGTLLQPIFVGFPTYLMSPLNFIQRPAQWLLWISRLRATTAGAPNFALDFLVQHADASKIAGVDLSSLDVFFCGAEPIRTETLERFTECFAAFGLRRESLMPCYGMAEASLMIACSPRGTVWRTAKAPTDIREVVGCGQTAPGTQVTIVDPDTLRECPDGVAGEIWVRGPGVAAGYHARATETRDTFHALLHANGPRWLRTGDLGFLSNGELFPTGRIKDVLIQDGRKYVAEDVEEIACRQLDHEDDNRVVAFPIRDAASAAEWIGLAIESTLSRTLSSEMLLALTGPVRNALANELSCTVSEVFWVKPRQLPRTSSGKIQRAASCVALVQGHIKPVAQWRRSQQ